MPFIRPVKKAFSNWGQTVTQLFAIVRVHVSVIVDVAKTSSGIILIFPLTRVNGIQYPVTIIDSTFGVKKQSLLNIN